jgi:hypothetical protein
MGGGYASLVRLNFTGSKIDRVCSANYRGLKSDGEIFFEATPL